MKFFSDCRILEVETQQPRFTCPQCGITNFIQSCIRNKDNGNIKLKLLRAEDYLHMQLLMVTGP